MSPEDMGMGLKSCVAVYLLELVRLLLQYKWGTILQTGVVLEAGGIDQEEWYRSLDQRDTA